MTDEAGLTFQECVHQGQQSQPGVQESIWILNILVQNCALFPLKKGGDVWFDCDDVRILVTLCLFASPASPAPELPNVMDM